MLSNIKHIAFFVLILFIPIAIGATLLYGAAFIVSWSARNLYPTLITIGTFVFYAGLFTASLSFLKKIKPFCGIALLLSSYLFGLMAILLGFLITYDIWGPTGAVIGFFLGIIGLIPTGLISSGIEGRWGVFTELMFVVFIYFAFNTFGKYQIEKSTNE